MAVKNTELPYQTIDEYVSESSSIRGTKIRIIYVNARSLRNKSDSM